MATVLVLPLVLVMATVLVLPLVLVMATVLVLPLVLVMAPVLVLPCGDIHLILHQRIDDLSDFMKYSWAGVRAEKERAGKRGEPSVLISYHCSITPTVTFML